jgi:hypothetical protein
MCRAKKEEVTGDFEHLSTEKFCNLYYSFNIDNLIKSVMMKEACMNGKQSGLITTLQWYNRK